MNYILATKDREEIIRLMRIVHSRGLEGEHGTWEEFIKNYCPLYRRRTCYSLPGEDGFIPFLTTLHKKDDLRLLLDWLLSPSRFLVKKFTQKSPNETTETAEQRLVRTTLTHHEHPLDYFFPSNNEDWIVTGIGRNKHWSIPSDCIISANLEVLYWGKSEMISLCCDMVLCEDGSEAPVRVVAIDRDLEVVLEEFVKPNQPVADYRTAITGLTAEDLENATTLSVVDIQEKLRMLLSVETIMIGHSLNNYLNALKIDHVKIIDTSLVFKYDFDINPSLEHDICPLSIEKRPRPSLNYLCKSILGYEAPNRCLDNAEAAMKLVLAIVENGVETSVPLTEEVSSFKPLQRKKILSISKMPRFKKPSSSPRTNAKQSL